MANYNIQFIGADTVIKALDEENNKIIKAVQKGVSDSAALIEKTSKEMAPVVTGNLVKSIHSEFRLEGLEALVGPDMNQAPYAAYVEFGTKNFSGRHYMEKSFYLKRDDIQRIISYNLISAL